MFVKAPALKYPVPLIVKACEVPSVKPLRSSVPAETVTIPAYEPSGVNKELPTAPTFNIPVLIVNPPVKVFVPDKVKVPVPAFAKATVAAPS